FSFFFTVCSFPQTRPTEKSQKTAARMQKSHFPEPKPDGKSPKSSMPHRAVGQSPTKLYGPLTLCFSLCAESDSPD
ncbi:MAG: hypothetical protein ACLTTQ_09210, partial [Christensenellales bacterium]